MITARVVGGGRSLRSTGRMPSPLLPGSLLRRATSTACSEAEWEYACRAGTTTQYSWGDEISSKDSNYGWEVGETREVGAYPANPFGLYDMHGSVWEWVEDCWNDNYQGAPEDGSAWVRGDCSRRASRGGCWAHPPQFLRATCRDWNKAGHRIDILGFRVARELTAEPAMSRVEDTHWSKVEYHDSALSGRITFNYSNNNDQYSIGRDEFFFETKWSRANDRAIHLYNDPPSIIGVADASNIHSYKDIGDPSRYDMSSRARTIQRGAHALIKNINNKYAVLKILAIKDRTRLGSVDELTFEFWILADGPEPP
jgi:hypothetical protein